MSEEVGERLKRGGLRALEPGSALRHVSDEEVNHAAKVGLWAVIAQVVGEMSVECDTVDARLKKVMVVEHRAFHRVDIIRVEAIAFVICDVPASVSFEEKIDEALQESGKPLEPPSRDGLSPFTPEGASFGNERVLKEGL
jgi:hypothetical protein